MFFLSSLCPTGAGSRSLMELASVVVDLMGKTMRLAEIFLNEETSLTRWGGV